MQHPRTAILGDGHLGWAVASAASERGQRTPVIGRPPGRRHDPTTFDGIDLVIDATVGSAVAGNVGAALDAGVRRFVIATTGWTDDRETVDAALRAAGASAVAASNFSLGVALFAGLVFFTSMPFGAAAAAIQLITPSRMRATASAIYLCVLNLVGLGLGPTLVAVFTDFVFVDDAAVGRSLAAASILATIPAIVVFWSVFTGLTAAAVNFATLLAARFVFGAGEAGAFPGVARAISTLCR